MQRRSALSSCRRWAPAISRLSPILHWRPGPSWDRKEAWGSGSRLHSRIMLEIGPGPPSPSARQKNTQDPTDMSSISNTSQRKRRRGGGSTGGDWGSLLSPQHEATGCFGPPLFCCILHPRSEALLKHFLHHQIVFFSFSAQLHCLHHTFHS